MPTNSPTPASLVRSQLQAIAATSASTLATFAGLVMILPIVDLWAKILPPPGKYSAIARATAVLLSALLAYREVRHPWPTLSFEAADVRPSGTIQVVLGVGVSLLYLSTQGMTLGGWASLLHATEYAALIVLMSFGFTRLAKKAYDFAHLRGKGPGSDRSLISFATVFFTSLTAVVTGFAVLNELVGLLPPIIRESTVSAGLAVVVAIAFIGANYTSDFLEQNLGTRLKTIYTDMQASLAKKNIVEAGLVPATLGILFLIAYLALDTRLSGQPSDKVSVELLAIGLKIGIFSFLSFALWRLGVSEYRRRHPV